MSTAKKALENTAAENPTVALSVFQELEQLSADTINSVFKSICRAYGDLFEQRVKVGGMPEAAFWADAETDRDAMKLATYRDSGKRDVFGAVVMEKCPVVSKVAALVQPLIKVDIRNARTFAAMQAKYNGSSIEFFRAAYSYAGSVFKLIRDLIATGLAQESDRSKLEKLAVATFATSETHITDAKLSIIHAASGAESNVAHLTATEKTIKTWLKTDRDAKENGGTRPDSLKWS